MDSVCISMYVLVEFSIKLHRQEDYAIQWTVMNFVKKYCHSGKHIPLVVLEVLSTELTISWARSLPSVAPLFSYRNKLRDFLYTEYAI